MDRLYGYNIDIAVDRAVVSEETCRKISKSNTGRKHSEESKRKMSESHKGKKMSEKQKEILRERWLGDKNPSRLHPRSEETITKWRESNKGFRHTEEAKRKIGEASIGRLVTPEQRLRRSVSQRGEKCKHSKLTWNKVSEIRFKYQSGEYTQKQLGLEYGVARTTIQCIVENKRWVE